VDEELRIAERKGRVSGLDHDQLEVGLPGVDDVWNIVHAKREVTPAEGATGSREARLHWGTMAVTLSGYREWR
jgi:hypothetical protein